jgi:GNAT superfamily N-acetyltransferase
MMNPMTEEYTPMLTVLKRGLTLTMTDEPDEHYLKYLRRRAGLDAPTRQHRGLFALAPGGTRLDISLDDDEGDVMAGLAAHTCDGWLHIEALWVDAPLRGKGWGARLLEAAEAAALERGCTSASALTLGAGAFFAKHGYSVSGKVALFPSGAALTWLEKCLEGCAAGPIPYHAG